VTSEARIAQVGGMTDGQAMRQVLGHFASGIVVVTARGDEGPIGFTCQSFASLSLDPPLVTFAPALTSSTWPLIGRVGTFCVNVLAAGQEELSAKFAVSGSDKFAGVSWQPDSAGSPALEGACAWIGCDLHAEYEGGDHSIVVARVSYLADEPNRAPLLFHRGRYGVLAGAALPAQQGRGNRGEAGR
jgi:3-hydroxy-9,10-secoandrosta-1,3,5(10)-triene-9,17-dione monooxygenase reductase component